jgi:putative NADPH-quinone reductase
LDVLNDAGHEVTVEDLYTEAFDPAMSAAERESYYAESYNTRSVAAQVQRLLWAEAMVLVFPTWWFGFPAMLKGWFDRVWGPGVAYDHAADYGPIKPRLNRMREMLAVTSLGAPWWVDRMVMRQPVKKVLKTAIVGVCAPKCRFQMLTIYKSESLTASQVDRFTARMESTLSKWPVSAD